MKKVIVVLSLILGASAYADHDCRISVNPGVKYLPESFTNALKNKNYQIVSKKDAAISIELAQVLPEFIAGKIDVTHKNTGFRKRYVFSRELGAPDPLRAVFMEKLANAKSVSEYEAITNEILETTFNDTPDGGLQISIPNCADYYGEKNM